MSAAARVFISYRTSDGMDKATALARDLGRVFGDDAVFLDKDDLMGGSAWRQELGRAISARPVLLLLMTPGMTQALDPAGQPRIQHADDPVRRELAAAFEAGAHVIPVLCDGWSADPDTRMLPAPFDRIGELTWRKLRAYDWAHDIQRLVDDLLALGVPGVRGSAVDEPAAASASPARSSPPNLPAASPRTTLKTRWLLTGLVVAVLAACGWWLTHTTPATVAGRWTGTLWQGEPVTLLLQLDGRQVRLVSEPIPVAQRSDWAAYREFWQQTHGQPLQAVMYRAEGQFITDPGEPPRLDLALKVYAAPDNGQLVDSGNFSGSLEPDGQHINGRLWMNSAQGERPFRLQRVRR